jgi:hypothetical protein
MLPEETISPLDVERLLITDSPDEAMERIRLSAADVGLIWQPRPRWLLGESRQAVAKAAAAPAAR